VFLSSYYGKEENTVHNLSLSYQAAHAEFGEKRNREKENGTRD